MASLVCTEGRGQAFLIPATKRTGKDYKHSVSTGLTGNWG